MFPIIVVGMAATVAIFVFDVAWYYALAGAVFLLIGLPVLYGLSLGIKDRREFRRFDSVIEQHMVEIESGAEDQSAPLE